MKRLTGSLAAFLLMFGALCLPSFSVMAADKYFTWVDESGRVQHTLIVEEKNPLIEQAEAVKSKEATQKESASVNESAPPITTEPDSKSTRADVHPQDSDLQNVQVHEPELPADQPVGSAEAEKAPDSLPEQSSEDKPVDITVIDEGDFIDGDELQKNNYVRPGEPPRYYTWVDAEGRIVNTPIDGTALPSQWSEPPAIVIDGLERKLSTYDQIPAAFAKPGQVDAKAAEIFGLKAESPADQIVAFIGSDCCAEFDFEFISELDREKETLLEIDNISKKHIFASGRSPFELVLLPAEKTDYILRFRTFIQGQVFIPTFVYLDGQFKPTRVLTNISTGYTEENWFRHAYLEGLVDVRYQSSAERYLLVLTTRSSLNSTTLIENPRAKRTKKANIRHSEFGSMELLTIH
jgi:hypothetical protein